ncbi:MAG: insulinase family protein, partial [Alphaproteobacteria bacterium]|nr:insulinase family protein [Alphaproteobacteria bacterium]
MEKFKLSNGLQVMNAGYCKDYAACLGFNIGDMNVPDAGLAYLFVRILLLQKSGVLVYYGGMSTAFSLSGDDVDEILEKLYEVTTVEITEEYLEGAKAEIKRLIVGTEISIQQKMRFWFRRLVVGSDAATLDEALFERINAYSVDDVKAFRDKYYTAANAVLLIGGPDNVFFTLRATAEKLFGQMKSGESQG